MPNQEERKHYRPSWDDYFMAIAKIIAARGTCDRLYAGSVLVKENRIIATGYNGSPAGFAPPHHRGGVFFNLFKIFYKKNTLCIHCEKYVIACGIKRVVVGKIYRNPQAVDMLKEAGVAVEVYNENRDWREELAQIFSEDIPTKENEGQVNLKTE